jgi:DNA topoisomerase-1
MARTTACTNASAVDPEICAKSAGLIYVSPETPGIERKRVGKGFRFTASDGSPLTDKLTLARIKRLAIPPAWTKVWICAKENGHLQAVGYDDRGRKQYRYHARWREVRDETKYNSMVEFARVLPRIRRTIERHLKLPDLPREKVLATVIKILETGLIRVGNEEYARSNKSFGITTLKDRHARVNGSTIHFQFRGKSGKDHALKINDKRLARIVANCQAIPGQELFQYIDDAGMARDVTSSDVNEYIKEITQTGFTAKDFRTWRGTVLAATTLACRAEFKTKKEAKKNLLDAITSVAQHLGNTPAICRKCYIHPYIINSYLEGSLALGKAAASPMVRGLNESEVAVLSFLEKRIAAERKEQRSTLVEKLAASLKHRKKRDDRRMARSVQAKNF